MEICWRSVPCINGPWTVQVSSVLGLFFMCHSSGIPGYINNKFPLSLSPSPTEIFIHLVGVSIEWTLFKSIVIECTERGMENTKRERERERGRSKVRMREESNKERNEDFSRAPLSLSQKPFPVEQFTLRSNHLYHVTGFLYWSRKCSAKDRVHMYTSAE